MTDEQPTQQQRPVVVGYDGSDSAAEAVRWAARMAARLSAPLVVLNAADRIEYAHDEAVGIWDPAKVNAASREVAAKGGELATEVEPGLSVSARGSLLSPRVALDEASAGAQLVVVGTRGFGRVRSTLLGATAYGLSSHAGCPVAVVPAGAGVPGPDAGVVVGLDSSVVAERALDIAADQAQLWGAGLTVVSSQERRGEGDGDGGHAAGVVAEASERVAASHPGLGVTTSTPSGRSDEALLDASEGAGLLVMGSSGRSRLASLALGSTTRNVLHLSKVAVITVP